MKRVAKIILLLSMLFVFCKNGFGRRDVVHSLFPADEYMQQVDKKVAKIDGIFTEIRNICSELFRAEREKLLEAEELIVFEVRDFGHHIERCIEKKNNQVQIQVYRMKLEVEYEYFFENFRPRNNVHSEIIVFSYQNKILKIRIIDISESKGLFSLYNNTLFFDNNELILSIHFCHSPRADSRCTGRISNFRNYFKQNKHYNAIIRNIQQFFECGCGFNYIISEKSLNEIKEHLRENGIIN